MPHIQYTPKRFNPASVARINQANAIIDEYQKQGFDLTLRQLYYQFVSRDIVVNTKQNYKKLGVIINDARLAGLVDWNVIQDRTRNLCQSAHWDSPAGIIRACAEQYRVDRWEGQHYRPEVWIEKDALVGVIEGICTQWDVPYFSCRGYTSQSEMWRAGRRLLGHIHNGQTPIIFHFGDHDPSGKDMSRDIHDRLNMFLEGEEFEFRRLALTMDQIHEFDPPPNPAKLTDSRAEGYIAEFGDESWELDALEPKVIARLIEEAVESICHIGTYDSRLTEEEIAKQRLQSVANDWDD